MLADSIMSCVVCWLWEKEMRPSPPTFLPFVQKPYCLGMGALFVWGRCSAAVENKDCRPWPSRVPVTKRLQSRLWSQCTAFASCMKTVCVYFKLVSAYLGGQGLNWCSPTNWPLTEQTRDLRGLFSSSSASGACHGTNGNESALNRSQYSILKYNTGHKTLPVYSRHFEELFRAL